MRKHGDGPYAVAVLHGGPGAAGEMGPVAEELSRYTGILEPWQSAVSVDGQVEELRQQLTSQAQLPVVLIGYSWGAWLGWLLAARCPSMVRKLILVSSGVFEARYARQLMNIRLSRLPAAQREQADAILVKMRSSLGADRDSVLAAFGALMSECDTYAALPEPKGHSEPAPGAMNVFQGVWPEAAALRESGELLAAGRSICCPVTAIHGDYDPGPAAGVEEPLRTVLSDFRFRLLPRCGHTPWREQYARDTFYAMLREEIRMGGRGGTEKREDVFPPA